MSRFVVREDTEGDYLIVLGLYTLGQVLDGGLERAYDIFFFSKVRLVI